MSTIAIPMMIVMPSLGIGKTTGLLTHPQYPMMMVDMWTTQGEVGDSLAARTNTSNTNFSWGH